MLPPAPARPGAVRLAVVGEAPCSADFDNGGVFRSTGGRLVDRELQRLGMRRDVVHLTNAVLCDCRLKHRKEAAKCCAPRLQAELAALPPEVPVVTLDAAATRYALAHPKSTPIAKYRGSVCRAPGSGRIVLPMMHPAEVRKAPRWMPVWEGDWQRVGRVLETGALEWKPPEEQPGRRLWIPQTIREAKEALRALAPGAVAGDVETVGLGPTETLLVCLGFSDGTLTVVLPWSVASNGLENFWGDGGKGVVEATNAMLSTRVLVTHNGPAFDHIVMARYGFRWESWDDTLLLAHALRGHMPKNLPFVVTTSGIDVPPWKTYEDRGVDIGRLHVYNGRDTLYTMLAHEALLEKLREAA